MTHTDFDNLKPGKIFFHKDGWAGEITSSKLYSSGTGHPFFTYVEQNGRTMALGNFRLDDYSLTRPTYLKILSNKFLKLIGFD